MSVDYTKVLEEINSATVQISSYDYKMYCVAIAGVAFSILMSVLILFLTWRIANNQKKLQKKNLKLQLFEKRYAVYKAILDSKENSFIDGEYLFKEGFIAFNVNFREKYRLNVEKVNDNSFSAQFLFEKDLHKRCIFKKEFVKKDFSEEIDDVNNNLSDLYNKYSELVEIFRDEINKVDNFEWLELVRSIIDQTTNISFIEWANENKSISKLLEPLTEYIKMQATYSENLDKNVLKKFEESLYVGSLK